MRQKKAVTRETARRYRRARKKEKSRILYEFTAITGYHRGHAARALRRALRPKTARKTDRRRERKYGEAESKALRKVWATLDMPCGKRLAPYMEEIVPVMERWKEFELDDPVRDNLLLISAATIDRSTWWRTGAATLRGTSPRRWM